VLLPLQQSKQQGACHLEARLLVWEELVSTPQQVSCSDCGQTLEPQPKTVHIAHTLAVILLATLETGCKKRSVVLQVISWNGKPEKFLELKERLEGHFIQTLMGHCVHTGFLKVYHVKGGEVLNEISDFLLTEEQLRSDNRVMFRALLKSIF
jgi:hypothetical protein